jgi:hypothetical protein
VDDEGAIHLIYFKRSGEGGDLSYVARQPGSSRWTEPIRVNMAEESVVPNGSIGLAQIALSRQGCVHVTWFDMHGRKYWYTRLNDRGTAFEPQRNLVTRYNEGVEASAALATDGESNVYVVWHSGAFSDEASPPRLHDPLNGRRQELWPGDESGPRRHRFLRLLRARCNHRPGRHALHFLSRCRGKHTPRYDATQIDQFRSKLCQANDR